MVSCQSLRRALRKILNEKRTTMFENDFYVHIDMYLLIMCCRCDLTYKFEGIVLKCLEKSFMWFICAFINIVNSLRIILVF